MTGLRIRELKAAYGNAIVLTNVDLDVDPGEVVGLAGRNGAGKTTALRAVSGAMPRQAADLTFEGTPLSTQPDRVARRGVVHVPEGRGMLRGLSVQENLAFGAAAVGKPHRASDRDAVLRWFPQLQPLLTRKAGLLSGGEQQMLAVARGLMAQPKLLMVDELSLGLSPRSVREVLGAVLAACREQQVALLMVDQNLRTLSAHCDRLYVLADGATTCYEDPAQHPEGFWQSVYF